MSTVNGVPLHKAFHYHPKRRKGRKTSIHPSIHPSNGTVLFNNTAMSPRDAGGMANGEDPNQTALLEQSYLVFSLSTNLSFPVIRKLWYGAAVA